MAYKQYFNHNFKFPFVSWHMIAYGGISWQEPENTDFFQDVSLPGWQTPLVVKWHMLAYRGISWHIIPCKSGKKSGKVRGRTTVFYYVLIHS